MALLQIGCHRDSFPDVPAGYREFAYVTNGASNTVSVLDLVYLRQDRTLQVGDQPTGITANPKRNEVYVVNTKSGSISVVDTSSNSVVATIPVHRLPYFVDVDASGHRAYVANSGSNSVSVIDLDARREIAVAGAGEQPGLARISPDMRTLVVTNRAGGSVSVYGVEPYSESAPRNILGIPQARPTRSFCQIPPRPLSPAPQVTRSWRSPWQPLQTPGPPDRIQLCCTITCLHFWKSVIHLCNSP